MDRQPSLLPLGRQVILQYNAVGDLAGGGGMNDGHGRRGWVVAVYEDVSAYRSRYAIWKDILQNTWQQWIAVIYAIVIQGQKIDSARILNPRGAGWSPHTPIKCIHHEYGIDSLADALWVGGEEPGGHH